MVFTGVNVPPAALPGWMADVAQWLPLTHGLVAARQVAEGATLGSVGSQLLAEAGVGTGYVVAGLLVLAWLEHDSRRNASLDKY
jgi:ABC-2 type transport system permease protein